MAVVAPLQLAQMWTHDEIRVVCARPRSLEDHPDLAIRVRGALGRRLHALGPPIAHRFDPFGRPGAFEILYGAAAPSIGRPMAIDVDMTHDRVTVDLRLFGSAGFWSEQCRLALVEALSLGVSIRDGGRRRVALEPRECLARRYMPASPPSQVGGVALRCRTPVAVRSGRALVANPSAILQAAVTRVRELAPWYGATLQADFDELRRVCKAAAVRRETLAPFRWRRFSQRQGHAEIPVAGVLGDFFVEGPLTELSTFLWLAQYTHLGSHAALGLGRVEVALWP